MAARAGRSLRDVGRRVRFDAAVGEPRRLGFGSGARRQASERRRDDRDATDPERRDQALHLFKISIK